MKALFFAAAVLLTSACARRDAVQPEDDSDPAIRARIETVIGGRRDLDLRKVTIDVYSGDVVLSGIIPDEAQLKTLNRLIQRVPGVQNSVNNVVVAD